MSSYADALEAVALKHLTERNRMALAKRIWDGEVGLEVADAGSYYVLLAGDEVVCGLEPPVMRFLEGIEHAGDS